MQFSFAYLYAQSDSADFFDKQDVLEIGIKYSIKELRKSTKDSTWTNVEMKYFESEQSVNSLNVKLKTRGNFRLDKCYFSPVKVKIAKKQRKGTIFKGQKKMKLVMPCRKEARASDYVVKEYLVYKLYEIIAPYYFKTRLLDIHFIEQKNKKAVEHDFYGFFIEDIDNLADRYGAKEIKRPVPQPNHEAYSSALNALFQFMIGNVDYSAAYHHNGKMIYLDGALRSVLYDFDMTGFVDPSYGELPTVNGEPIDLESIKERLYRGYLRSDEIMLAARNQFIEKKDQLFEVFDEHNHLFHFPKEFEEARKYLEDFYKIIENDQIYKNRITRIARSF